MSVSLKPLDQQVIVITGASSGIGLAAAKTAAEKGAKVVLAARSGETLSQVAEDINTAGGQALAVTADVSDRQQVQKIADAALARFGRIDTWVNDAGLSIFGRIDQTTEADARRLFDINFWGVVNGSLVALPYLKQNGGALINLGSEVSEAVIPIQGMYSATKHAVKGFTDALRVEIEDVDKALVSITLIQPTATDTPFPQHARNYMDVEGKLPTPHIDPQKVADAILHAAVHPERDVKVGVVSVMNTTLSHVAPGLGDKVAAAQVPNQRTDIPPQNPAGALYEPSEKSGGAGETHGARPEKHQG